MTQLIGKIKDIYTECIIKTHTDRKIEKKIVILKMEGNQQAAIQFQGPDKSLLDEYRENQEVIIDVLFNGQRTSKRFYDNIIGKKIVKL